MGFIYNVGSKGKERKYSDKELLRRLFARMAPYKMIVLGMAILLIFQTLFILASPVFFGEGIAQLSQPSFDINLLFILAILIIICNLSFWICQFFFRILMGHFVPDFMVTLRSDTFRAIQKQSHKFFDEHESGRLTSRVANDASEVGGLAINFTTLVGNMASVILSFIILIVLNWQLSIVVLFAIPILIGITWGFRSLSRSSSKRYRKAVGSVNVLMSESFSGILVNKSYGMEKQSLDRFKKVNEEYFQAGFKRSITLSSFFPIVDMITGVIIVLVIFGGSEMILSNPSGMSAAALYVYIVYLQRFFYPMMDLASFYPQLQAALAAFERITEVQDAEPHVKDKPNALKLDGIEGTITFDNVTYGYKPGMNVLENFSLEINSGETVAIVGATGSGKTTLLNLIARFYDISEGAIKLDGIDIRDIELQSYRTKIGIVQQEPFLFAGTIEDNIRYGRREADEEVLRRVTSAVYLDEFLGYLKHGLKTNVRERGSRLSAGQRQLVTFARALLNDPPILLLDEATSSVDAYTEAVIQEALDVLFKNRTTIVVAHRLSTITKADRIIALDHGKIIEEGTHQELLAKGGYYADLYDTYFRFQSLDWKPNFKEPMVASTAEEN